MTKASVPASSDGDYPRSWDFKKDGPLTARHRELRAVLAPEYGTNRLVEKVVFECEVADSGEVVSVWLTDTVLRNAFARELQARRRLDADASLRQGETVTITPKGRVQPKTTGGNPHNGYDVVFEFAAPRPRGEDVLLAALGCEEDEPTSSEAPAPDDIPWD